MIDLVLVGMGAGHPDHLTRQGVAALNTADVILVPRKGAGKADLAELRLSICEQVVTRTQTRVVRFDMPVRDGDASDYAHGVNAWHDAIAQVWRRTLAAELPQGGRVALLVWGDPSLYDSTLRIAERLARQVEVRVAVVPGITALQALTAAHAITLNEIGGAVTITTGRRLREWGWPPSADTVAVMLDGHCAFTTLDPTGVSIWWGAYLGMPQQVLLSGALAQVAGPIVARREEARRVHGWIMDTYLLRRSPTPVG